MGILHELYGVWNFYPSTRCSGIGREWERERETERQSVRLTPFALPSANTFPFTGEVSLLVTIPALRRWMVRCTMCPARTGGMGHWSAALRPKCHQTEKFRTLSWVIQLSFASKLVTGSIRFPLLEPVPTVIPLGRRFYTARSTWPSTAWPRFALQRRVWRIRRSCTTTPRVSRRPSTTTFFFHGKNQKTLRFLVE